MLQSKLTADDVLRLRHTFLRLLPDNTLVVSKGDHRRRGAQSMIRFPCSNIGTDPITLTFAILGNLHQFIAGDADARICGAEINTDWQHLRTRRHFETSSSTVESFP